MQWYTWIGWVAYALSIIYAFSRGGSPERWVAGLLLAGASMTIVVRHAWIVRYAQVGVGVMLVDVLLLMSLGTVAIRARRSWPIVLTALHALTTASHFARALDPQASATVYAVLATFSGFTMPVVLAAGTALHRRRIRHRGADPSWS